MSVGLSSGDKVTELTALAYQLDRLYDTPLTNSLVESINEVADEVRQYRRCQYCENPTTRWMCNKPHTDN